MASNQNYQQLNQELQNELNSTSQLIHLISKELQEIKELTKPQGDLDNILSKNTSTMETLAAINNVDPHSEQIPPRINMDITQDSNANISQEENIED